MLQQESVEGKPEQYTGMQQRAQTILCVNWQVSVSVKRQTIFRCKPTKRSLVKHQLHRSATVS